MFRIVTYILLLGAIFFIGVTFGSKGEEAETSQVIVGKQVQSIDEVEVVPTDEVEPFVNEGNGNLTQKTAAALESGVSLFYELVVGMLYQFSSLFYETES